MFLWTSEYVENEKKIFWNLAKLFLLEQTYNSPNPPLNRGKPYNPCMDFWMSSSKIPVFQENTL